METSQCQKCGNHYLQDKMADWTICFSCMNIEKEKMGYAYVDSLGIGWTDEDLMQVGGIDEVEYLCAQSND